MYQTAKARSGLARLALSAILLTALAGCNAYSRIASIGEEPPLSPIENPVQQRNYKPVALPMPKPEPMVHQANSLWRPGSRAFFKDQRASRVGDILTINVTIEDSASLDNTTSRTRASGEDANLTNLLGLETQLARLLPNAVDPTNLVNLGANSSATGSGTVDRAEKINLKLAAIITQVLPNGNFVITGRQEMRVNYEVRELQVTGVVRPEDISSLNTVNSAQIAEARIAYGGRGHISDVQQARYGQQLYDIIFPF
ncbi:flagellar basal body L-ring protein FlgH [Oceanibacterium hippocampi]|uniref:Flagellar L-ring protein n=1 Tax=Oceanibacterium hippocampi TaxID=745714 RepID=A0A1Y5U4M2_9PROT|nr:flagellar basal body L-ring protein FlgH [Oceanibacterium hippocampi]SLN77134.1 Flagellar L-ring protein precursor [Oceanibacterium hippocampi]